VEEKAHLAGAARDARRNRAADVRESATGMAVTYPTV
jgi:hypothetical protein